jgi:Flp pilus assembly protein TadG
MKIRPRARIRDQRGAAAIEFALVLPILLLLLFGIIEFGFVINSWISVTHAAREGVRVYALTNDAAQGQTAGVNAAPGLTNPVTCTASLPAPDEAQMQCSTTYSLDLFVIKSPIALTSTARMRKEGA